MIVVQCKFAKTSQIRAFAMTPAKPQSANGLRTFGSCPSLSQESLKRVWRRHVRRKFEQNAAAQHRSRPVPYAARSIDGRLHDIHLAHVSIRRCRSIGFVR